MQLNAVGGLRPKRGSASNQVVETVVKRLGGTCVSRDAADSGDLYVQYGFKLTPGLRSAMDRRVPFVILDRGYFDDRDKKFSISFNGFHGLSMRVEEIARLPRRPHPPLQPWQPPGHYVYVYGQLPNDRALRGINMETWPTKAAQEASKAFMLPAKVRPHPKMINPWEPSLPSLGTTFQEAHVAVTWTSTVGVQAAVAGVPVVALHPASPAYDVAAHSYVRMRMPGRGAWVHDLSYRQYGFGKAELDSAIDYIRLGYPRAAGLAAAGEYDTVGLRV